MDKTDRQLERNSYNLYVLCSSVLWHIETLQVKTKNQVEEKGNNSSRLGRKKLELLSSFKKVTAKPMSVLKPKLPCRSTMSPRKRPPLSTPAVLS